MRTWHPGGHYQTVGIGNTVVANMALAANQIHVKPHCGRIGDSSYRGGLRSGLRSRDAFCVKLSRRWERIVVGGGIDPEQVTVSAAQSGLHVADNAGTRNISGCPGRKRCSQPDRVVDRVEDIFRQWVALVALVHNRRIRRVRSRNGALVWIMASRASRVLRRIGRILTEVARVCAGDGDGKI